MTDTTVTPPPSVRDAPPEAPASAPSNGAAQVASGSAREAVVRRRLGFGFGALAVVLIVLAASMPIWRSDLSAPQYPQGLDLTVYNDRVDGDVHEVDALNHYVGMKPYRFGDFWETELWWPTIGALIVLAVGATLVRKRWLARLARIGIWIAPLGVLADVQFRLYQFGHELKPGAALRIDEFTPKVIGGTSVLNFDVMSYPGEAMFAIWAAAALLSFGPWFVTRLVPALGRTLNALLSDETPATPRAAEATRG